MPDDKSNIKLHELGRPSSDTSSSSHRSHQTSSDTGSKSLSVATENSHVDAYKPKAHETQQLPPKPIDRDRDSDPELSKLKKQSVSKAGRHETSQKADANEQSEGNKDSSRHSAVVFTSKKLTKPPPHSLSKSTQSSQIPDDSDVAGYDFVKEYPKMQEYVQGENGGPAEKNAQESLGTKHAFVLNDVQSESKDGPVQAAGSEGPPKDAGLSQHGTFLLPSSYARMLAENKFLTAV